jgi:hypothetical protein
MKRFVTMLAVAALFVAPAAMAQDGAYDGEYGWTISNSSTDPFSNFGAPDFSTGTPLIYLWLQCANVDGASAAEFDVSPAGFVAVFGFSAVPPFLNGGPDATHLQLVLGCEGGMTLVGSFVANASYNGDICLVPSAANGYNVSVDCGAASFGKHQNNTIGFSMNGTADPACSDLTVDGLCTTVSVEENSWGAIKGLYR